jgi:hypothetical protein
MGNLGEEFCGDFKPFMVLENLIGERMCWNRGPGRFLITKLERIATELSRCQIPPVTEAVRERACAFDASAGVDPDSHKGFKKSTDGTLDASKQKQTRPTLKTGFQPISESLVSLRNQERPTISGVNREPTNFYLQTPRSTRILHQLHPL